jgi:glycerophosphoryl diester phosphodiesterase
VRPRPGDTFDLQAHRGGAGLRPENTLAAFGHALEIGVTTLECDVHVSLDGVAVVVAHPLRQQVPGAGIPLLTELFALASERGADDVRFNIETKFDALAPHETAPRERFADVLTSTVREAGIVDRTSVQSFDWEVLRLVRDLEPGLRLHVLAAPKYLQVGAVGASPWLGGLDIDDHAGDLVAAVASRGFEVISPAHGYPFGSGVADPAYQPFTTLELVDRAHSAGLAVIPYTVDDPATMRALMDVGVDGLVTNRPDLLRMILAERGVPLPWGRPCN